MLRRHAASSRVEHRVDVARGVLLQGRGDGVGGPRVKKVLEREDAVVEDAALFVADEDARKVGLLVPELGSARHLAQ